MVLCKRKCLRKMSENTDLKIGQRYGIWTIIEDTGKLTRQREKIYKSRSDYGEEMIVWHSNIKYGGSGYPVNQLKSITSFEMERAIRKTLMREKRAIIHNYLSARLSKEKLIDLYHHEAKSLQDIANLYNCSRAMIQRLMNGYGLQRRTRSEARKWAIRRGKFKGLEYSEMDEKFFTKWSPEMAWILGLIFTDGNLSNSGVVNLTSVDLELLEKVKYLLDSRIHIRKKTQSYDKSKYIYLLQFGHEKMTQNLKKLGLTIRKSLTMTFPDIPEEYVRHFIRGCWDGDGSVYFEKRRPGEIRASFVSGSEQFIKRIVLELYKIGIERQRIGYTKPRELELPGSEITIYKYKGRNGYYIRLAGKNCQRLFHYFYDEVDESLYLKRKYDVFKNVLDS